MRELRALVVDDSSLNRRTIAAMLREIPGITQVEVADDGAQALRMVESKPPDFITLDLEMPRLDGFEFLQLLMDRHPLPVVVVSGRSSKENVFRALELGAIDFLEKPHEEVAPLETLRLRLAEKVRVVQQLSPLALGRSAGGALDLDTGANEGWRHPQEPMVMKRVPTNVIVIGASTGGPKALVTLFRHLHEDVDAALVIAQHMPPRFTRTFADRLDRSGVVRVSEAKQYERLARGHAYVCPGGKSIEVVPSERGPALRVVEPDTRSHYVPSVNRLFRSAARVVGDKAIAVVLTGMGDDGAEGVVEIAKRGGAVLIEAPETALVSGMPQAARRAGIRHQSLGIWDLSDMLAELARPTRGTRAEL
ncbi:MAG TPA: chemotaxis-specific protein-glutamate methyltransferase CheB [Polyangiales bacterium]|nr:chemotaxis-specific protein-glutamate methyltransferase CheB [Polyangiales bacterium]